MRQVLLSTMLFLLGWPASAHAEWQLKPFIGFTFAGSTTFEDDALAVGKIHAMLGVNGLWIGEVLGLEADFGRASGFFQQSSSPLGPLVLRSSLTTLTGNVTVALPRRLSEYTLRPYFVGGAGLMRVRADNFVSANSVSDNAASMDLGGGVTGFLTKRVGLNWDIRHFRAIGGSAEGPVPTGGQLSFWRANMALAIRY